jgi:hypothetical protein
VEKQHIYTKNDDAEFEKEVFFAHFTWFNQKITIYIKISNNQKIDFLRKTIFAFFYIKTCFDPNNFC